MKDRPIASGGQTCPCGKAIFKRIARCNESTDGLNLHYDICPVCGFRTYAHNNMRVKIERYSQWVVNKANYKGPVGTKVMKENTEKSWVVEIYQKYCLFAPKFSKANGVRVGDYNGEALVAEIIVPAVTAQEASDKGWTYIEIMELKDAGVRRVSLEHRNQIVFTSSQQIEEAPDFDEELRDERS